MKLNNINYRPDIDGLRAIAILPVVLFHAHVPGLSGGFVGVDIFFVISGYLICSHIAEELKRNEFSIMRFYDRRCRRIVPALFTMFIVVFSVSFFILLPPDMVSFCRSLVAATVFVSNIFFWRNASYFDGSSEFKPLLHTWSLGVEEQFYILIPLILYVISKWFNSKYAIWLLIFSIISLTLSILGLTHATTANFYVLPTRFWELALGALVALGLPKKPIPRLVREVIAWIGVVLIIYSITMLSEEAPFPGWNALFPCFGAGAIIYIGVYGHSVITGLISIRPLVFVGKISYSLYLWHWPLLALSRYYIGRELTILETSTVLITSLLCAIASWRYVEMPVRQNTHFFNTRLVFLSTSILMVMSAIAGLIGVNSNGYDFRYPGFKVETISGQERYNFKTCFLDANQSYTDWRGDDCFLTKNRGPSVLLWGDSFAAHYAPGITDQAKNSSADFLQYTASACPPILGFQSGGRPNCHDFNENMLNVLAHYNISTVVMVGRWEFLFKRGVSVTDVVDTVNRLNDIGVKVYVIGQSPVFYNDVQTLYAQADYPLEAIAPLSFKLNVNTKLETALPYGTFINPLEKLCMSFNCRYRQDNEYIISDMGHFSAFGSKLAVGKYFPFFSDL